MADLYVASPKELIDAKSFLMPGLNPDSEAFTNACALIEACNADCTEIHGVAHQPTPIFLPQNAGELKFVRPTFLAVKSAFQALSPTTKEALAEIGIGESCSLLEGLRDWKNEHIDPNYGAISLTSDTNTFGGGALGVLASRASSTVGKMKEIEGLLEKYASATGQERRSLRPRIQNVYRNLQQQFQPVVEKYIKRSRHKNRSRNRIYSPGRAIQGSKKGYTAPLTAKSGALLKATKNFRMIGRGIIMLDLGIRVNNWARADNKIRTAVAETAGFSLSFLAGYVGARIGLGLVLGPFGWGVVIIGTGITAVLADYMGKDFAVSKYDQILSWNWLK